MNDKKGIIHANFVSPETLGSLANTTIAYAISQGITFDEIAQAIDISELDYANQDARLPDPVVGELMNMLIKTFPERAISMEIARCAPFSMLGGLVQGAMFATDVESVLTWFIDNSTVLADQAALHLEKTTSEVAFVVGHPFEAMDQGHTLEATMGLIWRLLNTITLPKAPLMRVELANKKAVPVQPYETFFQAPVSFQTGRNALFFSLDTLRLPVRSANAQMFAFIRQHFADLRQKLNGDRYPKDFALLYQSIMDNAAHGTYEVSAAAAAANLSLRTAQRLAKQHGTSMQKLINDIRQANAKTFLSNSEMTIETVAKLVGYADVRAFRKAFKRWTGLSPKEYRNETFKERQTGWISYPGLDLG
ncbi:MAG: helix-turn-helix domain-containing protein [Cyanobacteria bacterium P01_F01_bin.150]